MSHGRHAVPAGRRHRASGRAVVTGASVLSICAGVAVAAHIGAFLVHSSVAGRALVTRERTAIAAATGDAAACERPPGRASDDGRGQPDGLLEAPALGLVAPVLQGTGDSVLSDAVGHDPASVWPGQPGTSVLSAHDVTWFSHIGQLRPGSDVRYVTPCWTYTYAVTSHKVVAAGSPVYNSGAARLVLDTCYPLDALYITSTRYLVYANLVGSSPTHASAAVPGRWPIPAVLAPAPLAAEGLSLTRNPTPLGTLQLTGTPSRAWAQSSAPLQFQAAALAVYFGAVRSAAQDKRAWWDDLAPSVATSAAGPLWGGRITAYDSALMVTLRARGTRSVAATLTADVSVAGPDGAGRYDLVVDETVSRDKLTVTRVRITPAP
ncbi:MAG TPA: class D sortase [Trebonia sp.]|jgi:sortase A|nr:class D sortase [Trebonia sp.]